MTNKELDKRMVAAMEAMVIDPRARNPRGAMTFELENAARHLADVVVVYDNPSEADYGRHIILQSAGRSPRKRGALVIGPESIVREEGAAAAALAFQLKDDPHIWGRGSVSASRIAGVEDRDVRLEIDDALEADDSIVDGSVVTVDGVKLQYDGKVGLYGLYPRVRETFSSTADPASVAAGLAAVRLGRLYESGPRRLASPWGAALEEIASYLVFKKP